MTATQQLLSLEIDTLMPDPTQPRKTFAAEEIGRLADSIKARGVLSPLRVAFDEERKSWRIVLGESRWRAAKQAGLTHLPCLPMEGQPSEVEILMDQVVENEVRNQLLPIELARAIDKLRKLRGCTASQLARELGMSGGTISRTEALLSLPADVQSLVDAGKIPPDTAYQISRLPDAESQLKLSQDFILGRVSRDKTAAAVQAVVGKKKVTAKVDRLSITVPGGITVTISAATKLTHEILVAAIEQIRKQAESLKKAEKDAPSKANSLAS